MQSNIYGCIHLKGPATFHTSCRTVSQDGRRQTGMPTPPSKQFPRATQVWLSSKWQFIVGWTTATLYGVAIERGIWTLSHGYQGRMRRGSPSANEKHNTLETSQQEIYSHRQKKQNTAAHKASAVGFRCLASGRLLHKSDVLCWDAPKAPLPPRLEPGYIPSLRLRNPENTLFR